MRLFLAVPLLLVGCASNVPAKTPEAPPSIDVPTVDKEPVPAPPVAPKPVAPPVDPPAAKLSCKKATRFGPVQQPRGLWESRPGAKATKYSQLKTTKSEPAHTCGARHSYDFIARLRCDDGSRAVAGPTQARSSRVGNVGSGGRCGHIVDLYKVTCPEGSYSIHVDMYWCPAKPGGTAI